MKKKPLTREQFRGKVMVAQVKATEDEPLWWVTDKTFTYEKYLAIRKGIEKCLGYPVVCFDNPEHRCSIYHRRANVEQDPFTGELRLDDCGDLETNCTVDLDHHVLYDYDLEEFE